MIQPSRARRLSRTLIAPATRLDPVTRGWLVVVGGSFSRLALGLVASVIIARALGPETFGVYALLAATGMIAGALADAGLTSAAVRYVAPHWPDNRERVQEYWRVFFWLRLMIAAVVVLLGLLATRVLAGDVLGLQGHDAALRIAFIGVAAIALSGTVTAMLQATGHFGRLAAVMLTNAGLTAVLAVGLSAVGALTLTSALLVLGIGTSLASFLVGYWLLPGRWPLSRPGTIELRTTGGRLLRFGSWLWLAGLFAILTAQLDVFLVNYWAAPATVGAYALALSLASKVDVINHSLYTVLLPTASALTDRAAIHAYLRQSLLRGGIVCLLLLPLFPLAGPLIEFFYGSAFRSATGLFQGLLAVALFDLLLAPVLMLAFTFNQPRLLAGADALRAGTLVALAALLVPPLGAAGIIVARFVARLTGATLILMMLARRGLVPDETDVEVLQPLDRLSE